MLFQNIQKNLIQSLIAIFTIMVGLSAQIVHAAPHAQRNDPPPNRPNQGQNNQNPAPAPNPNSEWKPSVVLEWNEVMLAAIRNDSPRPTVVTRQLFMVHKAIYDSWAMYDQVAMPTALDPAYRQRANRRNDENKAAAISQAAYHMLTALFPNYVADTNAFARLIMQQGYDVIDSVNSEGSRRNRPPAEIGLLAAQAVMAAHESDGSNAANDYADMTSATFPAFYTPINGADPTANNAPGHPGFNPNRWHPLRVPNGTLLVNGNPAYDNNDSSTYNDQIFLTPHWGAVIPFAMSTGSQFRPPTPPQAGSLELYTDALGQTMTNDAAYHVQLDEVVEFSANLTDYQKVLAEFWADGPRSETPPGHWNQLAQGVAERDYHAIDQDAKLFFALNSAIFDAGIAGWDAKRAYDYIRPISAIHHKYYNQQIEAWGGPNQGKQTILGQEWRPYQALNFVTPPFAEYISGHSIFSAAAAEVLTQFTGSNRFYDGETMTNGDYNGDGIYDMLGEFIATVGSNNFEASPSTIVTLQWPTFQDAAVEAGISRLYGGIHIQDGNLHGQTMGTQIGQQAYTQAERYWTAQVRGDTPRTTDATVTALGNSSAVQSNTLFLPLINK